MEFQKGEILDHPGWKYVDTYIKSDRNINSRPRIKPMMADCEEGKIDLIQKRGIIKPAKEEAMKLNEVELQPWGKGIFLLFLALSCY